MTEDEWNEREGPEGWTYGLVAFKAILNTIRTISPTLPLEDALDAALETETQLKQELGITPSPKEPPKRLPKESDHSFITRLAKFIDHCPAVTDELPHKKINAIKALRSATGAGLKESKEAVEMWVAGDHLR